MGVSLYHLNRHSMPFHVEFLESDCDIRRQGYDILKTASRIYWRLKSASLMALLVDRAG